MLPGPETGDSVCVEPSPRGRGLLCTRTTTGPERCRTRHRPGQRTTESLDRARERAWLALHAHHAGPERINYTHPPLQSSPLSPASVGEKCVEFKPKNAAMPDLPSTAASFSKSLS